MCGIAGAFGDTSSDGVFNEIFDDLRHRGPDSSGVFRDSHVSLGMNRLCFRGGEAKLPLEDSQYITAFNGQVYGQFNAEEYTVIQDGLTSEVRAATDNFLADGMYAYCQYLPSKRSVILSTDRHFIKPLFVRNLGSKIVFASEISALLRQKPSADINLEALTELFAYGWYLSDETYADGVSLVWKHDICIDLDGMHRLEKRSKFPTSKKSINDFQLKSAIKKSVERSILGAGPIGLALSGGLDSSILAWELNALGVENLICITVQNNDGTEDISSLAELNLPSPGAWQTWKHKIVTVDDEEFLMAFTKSTIAFGQPTTMSSLPLYQCLADAASAEGVRAILLGEGVDEYFGGYGSYSKVGALSSILDYYNFPSRQNLVKILFGETLFFAAEQRFKEQYKDCSDLRMIEGQMRLTRLLLRSDVCLMARSIEGRVPYLYNNIPEIAMSISWEDVTKGKGKMPLRHAYRNELGKRAFRPKVRFKSSDEMLLRCLTRENLQERIEVECSRIFGINAVRSALSCMNSDKTFDADILCLMMSLTFLLENGLLYAN